MSPRAKSPTFEDWIAVELDCLEHPQPKPAPGDAEVSPVAQERTRFYLSDKSSKDGARLADQICAALQARIEFGVRKYGRPLETHNGRSYPRDLREEQYDALHYACGLRMEHPDNPQVARIFYLQLHVVVETLRVLNALDEETAEPEPHEDHPHRELGNGWGQECLPSDAADAPLPAPVEYGKLEVLDID